MNGVAKAKELFIGCIIHSSETGELIVHEIAGVLIEGGKIISIVPENELDDVQAERVKYLKRNQFLIPGFIDGHIHAVQLPNLGIGYDKPLLDWLESYTFPLEIKYSDEKFAEKVFDAVVKRTLKVGTTTACYFASLYGNASMILARKAAAYGQRAFIGKVNMNQKRKDGYWENTEDSLNNTHKFIRDVLDIGSPLVRPVITPRFVLSCDMELMRELGKIAKDKDLCIQTHVSENLEEVAAVRNAYKNHSSYCDVYDDAGLITNKTVLAHGIYLKDCEIDIIKKRDAAVIHCPSSNLCLKSGLCDVQRLRAAGVTVGLGTDVSGGQTPSIIDAMRSAIHVSNNLSFLKPGYEPLNYKDVFYLATLGGANALSLQNQTGNFMPGKQFDALVIDLDVVDGPLDTVKEYTLKEQLQRFIFSGDDRNIVEVYVAGHQVV